jgi:hypothetical protein
MTRAKLLLPLLVLAFAPAAAPVPAAAQCRLCKEPSTAPVGASQDGELALHVETSLNFDRVIVLADGEGSATLRPDGSRSTSGSVGGLSGRAMAGMAMIEGEPGRFVRVELPRRITLYAIGGGEIVFDDIVSDLPSAPRLDSSGKLSFRFGGRLRISGDAEGSYRGDVPVSVEYQ